jgi:hypothetical protein
LSLSCALPQRERFDGPPRHIVLRRSASLHACAIAFAICATIAFHVTFGAQLGMGRVVPLSCAVAALLGLALLRWSRAQPAMLQFGVDTLTLRNHAGATLAEGPVAACGQWSGHLLMLTLTLAGDGNRSRSFLVAADMLDPDAFRRLAVIGRRGARAAL